jgi:hypothetical protein
VHCSIRQWLGKTVGATVAAETRIIYGGKGARGDAAGSPIPFP